MINNLISTESKILVTGGSGFLGSHLVNRLNELGYNNVAILARNEGNLIALKEKFPWIDVHPGDVADQYNVLRAAEDAAAIFHLAAFKHVGLAELHAMQCLSGNLLGSLNLIEAANRFKPSFLLTISTDKAAQVSGVYGATKMLMERCFVEAQQANDATKFRVVRYGNVLYSTGSVLCKWRDAITNGKSVTVTDLRCTRFYWTVDQAIDLIFDCLKNASGPEPYVPSMKSIVLRDLLEAMKHKYAPPNSTIEIVEIGLQKGENLHERITEDGPLSNEVACYTFEEIVRMV
jgi:UDP-N-acetylglucosamine 4,6-dehydratase